MATDKAHRVLTLQGATGYVLYACLEAPGVLTVIAEDVIADRRYHGSLQNVISGVMLPDRAMDTLARAWTRYREGHEFGKLYSAAEWEAKREELIAEVRADLAEIERES